MAIKLAAIEVGLLILGISGTVLLWARPLILDWIDVAAYMGQALILALCCVVSFYYNDLYDIRKVKGFSEFMARLVQALGVAFILLAGCYAFFRDLQLTSGPFISSIVILGGLVIPVRAAFYALMRSHALSERILILGTGPLAWKIATEIVDAPALGYDLVGFVDDNGHIPLGQLNSRHYRMLGSLDDLDHLVESHRPARIVVAMTERRGRLPVHQLLQMRLNGIVVEEGIEVYERLTGKLAIESLTPSCLVFSRDFERPLWHIAVRRTVSLMAAAVGLILSLSLMGIIAVLILLDSGGPILFVQERVGLRGRIFRLLKFRTMRVQEFLPTKSAWERDDAARVTRVGRWIRKFRCDELPQFINILKGDMDLIGPRPEMACNAESMTEKIPYYALRHIIRPGITGWAQIKHGYSVNQDDVTEKVRYDLYYIKQRSGTFDLRILIDTVKIVLFGRGADAPHTYQPATTMEARHR
jgi:sugar transferase (PEP-CTERM system associated)